MGSRATLAGVAFALARKLSQAEQERDVAQKEVRTLREAVDDLWGCIRSNEIRYLRPSTRRLALEVHDFMWHEEAADE